MGRLVDIDSTSLEEVRIGALPVVNRFLARLGLKSCQPSRNSLEIAIRRHGIP